MIITRKSFKWVNLIVCLVFVASCGQSSSNSKDTMTKEEVAQREYV